MTEERSRLIAGAWNVLSRNGFEGFKVQLVLRDSHLSARTFYRHFSGKDELLLTLLDDEMQRSGVLLAAATGSAIGASAQVEAWLRTMLAVLAYPKLAARARLFSSHQDAMHRFPAEVAASARHLLEPLEAAIERGQNEGAFTSQNAQHDAMFIYLLTAAVITRTLAEEGHSLEEVTSTTVDFALRALRAPSASIREETTPRMLPG